MGRAKSPLVRAAAHIRIAAYLRLSRADDGERQAESNSISMQRSLIQTYIASYFTDCRVTEYREM